MLLNTLKELKKEENIRKRERDIQNMRKQNDIRMIVMRMGDILGRGEEQGEERTRKGEKNMRKQNIETRHL